MLRSHSTVAPIILTYSSNKFLYVPHLIFTLRAYCVFLPFALPSSLIYSIIMIHQSLCHWPPDFKHVFSTRPAFFLQTGMLLASWTSLSSREPVCISSTTPHPSPKRLVDTFISPRAPPQLFTTRLAGLASPTQPSTPPVPPSLWTNHAQLPNLSAQYVVSSHLCLLDINKGQSFNPCKCSKVYRRDRTAQHTRFAQFKQA